MKKLIGLILIPLLAGAALAVNGVTLDPSRTLFNARQLGMGGVSVAFANDANGVFANPACLTGFEFPQLTTSSRRLMLDESQYLLLGWAMPTDYGTFGLGYAGLGVGGSLPTAIDPGTNRIIQDPTQEAGSYSNSVLALSYTRDLTAPVKMTVGANLKFFTQAITGTGASDKGTGMGIDLGATYRPLSWLTAGAVLQNLVGGSVKWTNAEDKMGGYYKLGIAANVLGASGEALYQNAQPLRAGIDLDLPAGVLGASNSLLYHLGLEYFPAKNIALRGGLNQEQAGSGLTLGIGMVNGGFRFDYAYYQRPGMPGDTPHYFSLSYVGERVLTYDRQLKKKLSKFRVIHPKDRLITDQDLVDVSAEGYTELVIDQKRTWTVTSVSATSDAFEVTTREALTSAFANGRPIATPAHFAFKEPLREGRNVIQLVGFTSAEIISPSQIFQPSQGTAEIRVLRIVPFKDTPVTFWAIEPIMLNGILGLVTGYPDNTFKPDKGITRAELVTLLVKSLGVRPEELDPLASSEVFTDVQKKHWAAKYIVYGNQLGYVTGYKDGTFKPNKVLTRAEGVTLLARYAKLAEAADLKEAPFPDLKPEFWASKFIEPAKKIGMLNYLAGKEFKPADIFTRAEACEVLYQVPAIKKRAEEWWNTGIVSAAHP
ncbi:MAG: S-layer homology domain-containing protein [Candidatus Margulisiibacteriota bacterium]